MKIFVVIIIQEGLSMVDRIKQGMKVEVGDNRHPYKLWIATVSLIFLMMKFHYWFFTNISFIYLYTIKLLSQNLLIESLMYRNMNYYAIFKYWGKRKIDNNNNNNNNNTNKNESWMRTEKQVFFMLIFLVFYPIHNYVLAHLIEYKWKKN